jgi:hypothetical protein
MAIYLQITGGKMDIPQYLDLKSRKFLWDEVKDHRWAKGVYLELGEQMVVLNKIPETKREMPENYKQIGVVEYLANQLAGYLTLKKV